MNRCQSGSKILRDVIQKINYRHLFFGNYKSQHNLYSKSAVHRVYSPIRFQVSREKYELTNSKAPCDMLIKSWVNDVRKLLFAIIVILSYRNSGPVFCYEVNWSLQLILVIFIESYFSTKETRFKVRKARGDLHHGLVTDYGSHCYSSGDIRSDRKWVSWPKYIMIFKKFLFLHVKDI